MSKIKQIQTLLNRYRLALNSRLTSKPAVKYWEITPLDSPDLVYQQLLKSLDEKNPTCVARIGGVEAQIMLWAQNISLPCYPLGKWRTTFADTEKGATNAGIRPYTKSSYQDYGKLAFNALFDVDHLAIWRTNYEPAFINQLNHHPTLSEVEHFAPTMDFSPHWIEGLDDKQILIVSPFKDSIQQQIGNLNRVWPSRQWFTNSKFSFYRFPYLIDDECSLNWRDVYDDIAQVLKGGEYDVALFGCGGLGCPLASLAKRYGRIGFHLGGHLQLIFGIYGNRHLEQWWHQRWINSAWIRLLKHEVPESAKRVENSCYW